MSPSRSSKIALAVATVPLALFASAMTSPPHRPLDTIPPARVTGRAVDCVPLSQLRDSRVRDDRTIDFVNVGRTGWRVTLPQSCPGLGSERAFSYATSLSELCSTDIIHVIHQGGGPYIGASCGLGRFVPIELAR
ncbi:MAG: hypothetical protein JF593_12430 [Novosphingobium sp.]|nr:hypothetical protein [Novosphingobium sp.]